MGAVAFFGPGAEVLSAEFASDYSAVQIHCFRPGCDAENIQMILNILGEFVLLSSRHLQPLFKVFPVVANVVTRDRHFAQRLRNRVHMGLRFYPVPKISIRVFFDKTDSDHDPSN